MNRIYEQVIKGLECCKIPFTKCYNGGCPYFENDGCKARLKGDALALLKAQEPVKPVVDIDTWKCGNCGHVLEHQQLLGDNVLFHEQYNYCPECENKMNDLISRTALLKDLSYCAPELWQDEEYIKAKIMKQHTVDAAPVVHARWVKETDHSYRWHCSKCKQVLGMTKYFMKYCPFCGAKMETTNE